MGEEIESRLASASDLLSRGRYDEALALALDTLSVDSMDHKAAYLAGVCHLQKRQGELAIKYLTSATTMAPYNAHMRATGLAYVHKKEWTLAVDEYMVALEHATSTLKADVLYNRCTSTLVVCGAGSPKRCLDERRRRWRAISTLFRACQRTSRRSMVSVRRSMSPGLRRS